MKIMASKPSTSFQVDVEEVKAVTDFIFLGSKITVDGDCICEIKMHLPLGRKAMTNLHSILKKWRHHFGNKGPYSQSYGFSSSLYRCESWTTTNADTILMAESGEELRSLLMRVKEETENAGLKLSIRRKIEDLGIGSCQFTANRNGESGNSDRFYFLLWNDWTVTVAMKLKETCSLQGCLRR